MQRLSSKTCVVTGAARGIGRAIAARGCRYAIGAMKAAGTGSIINISSRSGLVGIPGAAAYASSKAAIRNHSKTVALYCAQQGWQIRCNSIHPAAILTPMWEPMLGTGSDCEARMRALVADTPLKRHRRRIAGRLRSLAWLTKRSERAWSRPYDRTLASVAKISRESLRTLLAKSAAMRRER